MVVGRKNIGKSVFAGSLVVALSLLVAWSPSAAADHEYYQEVMFRWDTTELDVLVLHVEDPLVGAAIAAGIRTWEIGFEEMGSEYLSVEPTFRVHWAHSGAPPADFSPDIVYVPQGFMACPGTTDYNCLGLGLTDSLLGEKVCYAFAPMAHWGGPITAYGTKAYRTAAHEFGHCLGLSHVFNHGQEYSPDFDLLGSHWDHACASNLNLMVLEKVFTGQMGSVTISAGDYEQAECPQFDPLL